MPKTSHPTAPDDVRQLADVAGGDDAPDALCPGCDVPYVADVLIDLIAVSCDGDSVRMMSMWRGVNDEVRRLLSPPRPVA